MKVHLLISHFDSPIAITYPKVRAAYSNRKDATKEAKRLCESPRTHRTYYWVQSVNVKEVA